MLDRQDAATAEQTLFVSRVIVGALLLGVLAFAGVVLLTGPGPGGDAGLMPVIAMVGVVIGVVGSFAAGRLVPAFYRGRGLTGEDLVAQAFFHTTLVRAAALEGGAFLCLITTLISGHRLGLLGAAVCAALLAALFPTPAAWDRFRAVVGGF